MKTEFMALSYELQLKQEEFVSKPDQNEALPDFRSFVISATR